MSERRAGLLADILSAYPDLRGSIRTKLDQAPRDAQLLILIFLAAGIGFVAGLPAAREQALAVEEPDALTGVLAGRLFAAIFITPLVLFALAALSHVAARIFGGRGSFWSARLALVWAVIVALPLLVVSAALDPILGAALGAYGVGLSTILSTVAGFGFLWIWAVFLAETEGFRAPIRVFALILVLPAIAASIPLLFGA
ncbi:YIP1 family protein [Halovulum dunhuangense]|uniref:YIP1 family protein n=1 Tax=Halovulum dunhuangense TaxID=1505036 RepID=A0A849L3B1_9RHOB|nr:YIP1 family protein [Halovulum dunhuangense]NNU80743.1 YIP1 family protein [Halovulum dunhuangense]